MAQLTPQDDYMKTALRLPRDLHSRIQEEAAASGRSMNSEIIRRLEASFSSGMDLEDNAAWVDFFSGVENKEEVARLISTLISFLKKNSKK